MLDSFKKTSLYPTQIRQALITFAGSWNLNINLYTSHFGSNTKTKNIIEPKNYKAQNYSDI